RRNRRRQEDATNRTALPAQEGAEEMAGGGNGLSVQQRVLAGIAHARFCGTRQLPLVRRDHRHVCLPRKALRPQWLVGRSRMVRLRALITSAGLIAYARQKDRERNRKAE